MKKKILVAALGTVLLVSAGTAAWATTGRHDPERRAAVKACVEEAKAANPDADRAALREAVKPCLAAAGITIPELTPEQRARRDALRTCVHTVREANPDADRPTIREAVRTCLTDAGFDPGAFRDKVRACVEQARAANPDADRSTIRPLVRECLAG